MDTKYIILLNALVLAFADKLVYRKFPCLAEKNRYYHRQLNNCRLCDRCLAGEGTNLTAQVEVIDKFGALKCRPCEPCEPGTYNKRRAFKCKPCRDCAASGRTVKTACAPDRNAVCGKRIKVKTTTTSELTPKNHIPPTHHPPPRDSQGDHIVGTDFRPEGQTVLNNHTHVNISAVAVPIVFLVLFVIILAIGVAVYCNCYRGDNRGCSVRQTNTINDVQPFMTRTGWGNKTSSVVSEIQPQAQRQDHVGDGINNNVCNTTDLEAGGGVSYRDYSSHFEQNSRTYFPTDSRENGYYTEIRQEEPMSARTMDHCDVLSTDVEEDAFPSGRVTKDTFSSTGAVNAVIYTATLPPSNTVATSPSNNLPPNTDLYQEQGTTTLNSDSISAHNTVAERGKRKTDRAELEQYVRKASKYIASNETYQTLGRHLNVSTTDIDIIKEEHPKVDERAYRTLRKWMEYNPKAKVGDLKRAICEIGKKHILDRIT